MKYKILLVVLLSIIFFKVHAQNFDLIVTLKGDSIACFIDSIGEKNIQFKMMKDFKWESTSLEKSKVKSHKKDAFNDVLIVFKEGTSYIERVLPEKKITSIKDAAKNSVYAELAGTGGVMTLNYERLFSLSKKSGITLRAGIGYISIVSEVNFIIGGPKSYFETGAGIAFDFDNFYESVRLGYGFRGNNGLILRAAPMLHYNQNNDDPLSFGFGLSVGYSF